MEFWLQNYLTRGFWGDEAWTVLISRLPVDQIIRVTGEDFHPPFYYFLVHFWGGAFGFGEITIRLISIIFFLLTPVVAFMLSKIFFKKMSKRIGYVAVVLLSPILFTYAFEARSYALLAFLTVSSAYALWKAKEEKGKTWKWIYFVLGGMSVYTHYYAWFILVSHGLYILMFEIKKLKKLLVPALGILAVQLPWLPTLFGQVGEVGRDYWIAPINDRTHLEFFLRVAGGDYGTVWQEPVAWVIAAAALLSLIYRVKNKKLTNEYKFLLTWLLVPTLIPTLISLKIPVFFYRYLIFSSIPLLMLVVDGLGNLPKKLFAVGMTAIIFSYVMINVESFGRYPRSMREESAVVYETKNPGDGPVYTVLPAFAETMYYVGDKDEVRVTNEGLVQFSGKSLLDAYERNGWITIMDPTEDEYWKLTPGPTSEYVKN
jgi:uncharacterized membrane protein